MIEQRLGFLAAQQFGSVRKDEVVEMGEKISYTEQVLKNKSIFDDYEEE